MQARVRVSELVRGYFKYRPIFVASAVLLGAATALSEPVLAQPALAEAAGPAEPPQPQYGWVEVWSGADATRDVWLLYSGVTLAPWSKDIYSDGVRLRMAGGFGQYKYDAIIPDAVLNQPCGFVPHDSCRHGPKRVSRQATYSYTDMLVGYHMRMGELTAKAFAGATIATHRPSASGDTAVEGTEIGATGVLELWLNLGPSGFTSVDLGYTTAFNSASARWRAGWKLAPQISIGPELRYDRNDAGSSARGGGFVRYQWAGGEVSVAAGVAGSMFGVGDDRDYAPYGTVNVLFQF